MTVASTTNRKEYAGDDATTSFATSPVVFFDTSDLLVYVTLDSTGVPTLKTEGTHYTASGGDGSTGSVSLAGGSSPHGALLSGTTLVIVRELPLTQEADFVNGDDNDAEVTETAFDKGTMMLQQLDARISRALVLPDGDVSGASTELPVPSANKLLAWDDDGLAVVNVAQSAITDSIIPTAFMETLLDDASAAAARATLVAAVSGANTDITSLASPALASATATTQAANDSSTKVATTAFVAGAVFTTGDVKLTLKTAADSGWVLMDDKTIGNASSAATGRANADTVALFTLLWTNTADAQCAVSTGRGANAAADYAANKTIALPKTLGRALATYGSGSGLTARALALATGVETHPLVIGEMAAHAHDVSFTVSNTPGGTAQVDANGAGVIASITSTSTSVGSGTAHQNMQPTIFLNVMVKL
jgi:hypothetical protein